MNFIAVKISKEDIETIWKMQVFEMNLYSDSKLMDSVNC